MRPPRPLRSPWRPLPRPSWPYELSPAVRTYSTGMVVNSRKRNILNERAKQSLFCKKCTEAISLHTKTTMSMGHCQGTIDNKVVLPHDSKQLQHINCVLTQKTIIGGQQRNTSPDRQFSIISYNNEATRGQAAAACIRNPPRDPFSLKHIDPLFCNSIVEIREAKAIELSPYLTLRGQHDGVVWPALHNGRLPRERQSRRRMEFVHLLDRHAELVGAIGAPHVQYATPRLVCIEFKKAMCCRKIIGITTYENNELAAAVNIYVPHVRVHSISNSAPETLLMLS